jgi:hypothetical protein
MELADHSYFLPVSIQNKNLNTNAIMQEKYDNLEGFDN